MLLEVKDISKKYGMFPALHPLSCRMESGELIGLVGTNGAGKSTLIKILATLIKPTAGDILLDGESIIKYPMIMQKYIGYLPQDIAIYPNLSAVEFLMYMAALKRLPKRKAKEQTAYFLERLHLSDVKNRRLSGFSGGMKQRVGIACALLGDPEIIIVDEPTTGLDPEERVTLRNILSELARSKIVILSTHIITDIEAAASRIMILKKGNLLFDSTPESLLHSAQGYVWEYIHPGSRMGGRNEGDQFYGADRSRHQGSSGEQGKAGSSRGSCESEFRRRLSMCVRGGAFVIRNQIWFIAQADFKERTRRFSFLVLCALSVLAAFLFVPDPNAKMLSITVDMQYFSQATNWTWIPMASALCLGVLLPVVGFFYLRNALKLDRKTGVIDFIYTSPVSRTAYLFGKYLSNLMILLCALLVVSLSAFCMTILKFMDMEISAAYCFSYFFSIIPGIFLCAALALMAEAVPLLQNRIGVWMVGSLYFAAYIVGVSFLFDDSLGNMIRLFDMTGFLWLKDGIDRSVYDITGKAAQVAMFVYEDGMTNHMSDNLNLPELFFVPLTFTWERILEKIGMIILGLILCVVASVLMQRYVNTRRNGLRAGKIYRKSKGHGILITELILTIRDCSAAWFLVMVLLWLSMFFADIETASGILWSLSMAWSCVLFSEYGCREKKSNVNILLPTVFHAYQRQLMARFCVGAAVSLFVSLPVILRVVLAGEFLGAAAGVIFALFVPALSIFLGQLSGSERLFEIIFLVICYVMLNTGSFMS